MSSLQIIRSAPSMQFQDLGRYGHTHHGISQGGALDLHAHCWANRLLENSPQCTTLEIAIGNAEFLALEDTNLALTGAEMHATIDGKPISNWSSFILKKGQHLTLKYASSGLRSYLAIQGGFSSPLTLGSSSTVLRNNIGSNLTEGTILENDTALTDHHNRTPHFFIPDYKESLTLRVTPLDLEHPFLNMSYKVSNQSDRMGVRLTPSSTLPARSGIISEGTSLGTIQLPPDGKPIILLNDRQTQGGYHKLGNIIRTDLHLLAQARPGTAIRLTPTSLTEARNEWVKFSRFFQL